MNTKKPYIERAVIEINGGCNYTCQMCPQTDPGRHQGFLKKMSLEAFEDAVKQSTALGAKVINLEGSGEPTLERKLPQFIEIVKKYNAKAFIFSNGYRFKGDYMKACIDAGLDRIRFSVIGYDRENYKKWMNIDGFNLILNNAKEALQYVRESGSNCIISSYHLITDNSKQDWEVEQYRKNFIDEVGLDAEIWKMHNWSGVYENPNERIGNKKTCGRPFAPEITIRAGGIDGKKSAVHPCCQVLGRDEEAVLGHLSENTIEEVWYGEEYEKLRQGHKTGDYPSYCKDCDFLVDDPEVLVYSNFNRQVHNLIGTEFSLQSYR